MRILLLNQTFYPDTAATAQQLTAFGAGLVKRGHEVTAVASRHAYDEPARLFPRRENRKGVGIHRVYSTGFGKSRKWKRAADFGSFGAACCLRLMRLGRFDAVVALTSPPLIAYLGVWFSRLWGARFYYWVMDLNPDEALAAGWLREGALVTRTLENLSRFSLRHAHRVIVLDRFMRERILSKGVPSDRVVVIAPWAHDDVVQFDLEGRNRFRAAHGLDGKFAVMYSGNHSPCHPLTTLLEAARQLANDPRYAFCFVGGGSEHGKVKQFAQEHGLANILCFPYQPLDALAASLSAADLHVVVMGNEYVGIIHPCKIYNVLTVGAPILYIGPQPSHVTDILESMGDSPHCARVAHGDVGATVRHIRRTAELGTRGDLELFRRTAERFSIRNLLPQQIEMIGGGG